MRTPAELKVVGKWLECRCPKTSKLMFKINLITLDVERRERNQTVYMNIEEFINEREILGSSPLEQPYAHHLPDAAKPRQSE